MKLLIRIKKQVALVCALTMLLGTQVTTFANDYTGHWAHDIIAQWYDNGIVSGYEDGTFRPNNPITRAEFASVLSELFGLVDTTPAILFADVKTSAWYEACINKVVTAHMMQGVSADHFNPSAPITRQEAAVALVNAYFISEEGSYIINFKDKSSIASWAKKQVELLSSNGYITGRPDGTFDPRASITRAEVLSMLNSLTSNLITEPGTYTTIKRGNVVINTPGVTLKDMIVQGDLYLTQGIDSGKVTLENVTVRGNIYITADDADCINFINSTVEEAVLLSSSGETHLKSLDSKLNVHTLSKPQAVILEGVFDEVLVKQGSHLSLLDATVTKMTILDDSNDLHTKLTLDHDSLIKELICNAPTDITGKGTIDLLNANNPNISSTIKPHHLIGTINGKDQEEKPSIKDDDEDDSDDGSIPTPSLQPYIQYSSITVEGQDFLNKGIFVNNATIDIDLNTVEATIASPTLSTAIATISNLKEGTPIKATASVADLSISKTFTVNDGAITVTASDLTQMLANRKNVILRLLASKNMTAHAEGVAHLLGTDLDRLLSKRDQVDTQNTINAYKKLLANKEHQDVKPFIDYLSRNGITLTDSKLSFTLALSADGLVARDYTINLYF